MLSFVYRVRSQELHKRDTLAFRHSHSDHYSTHTISGNDSGNQIGNDTVHSLPPSSPRAPSTMHGGGKSARATPGARSAAQRRGTGLRAQRVAAGRGGPFRQDLRQDFGKISARFRQDSGKTSGNDALVRQVRQQEPSTVRTRTTSPLSPLATRSSLLSRQPVRQRSGKKTASIPARSPATIPHPLRHPPRRTAPSLQGKRPGVRSATLPATSPAKNRQPFRQCRQYRGGEIQAAPSPSTLMSQSEAQMLSLRCVDAASGTTYTQTCTPCDLA